MTATATTVTRPVIAALGCALLAIGFALPPLPAQVPGPLPPADEKDRKTYDEKIKDAYTVPGLFGEVDDQPKRKAGSSEGDWLRRELVSNRFVIARRDLDNGLAAFQAGTTIGTLEALLGRLDRLTESEIAIHNWAGEAKPQDYVNAYERAVKFAEAIEFAVESRHKAGRVAVSELDLVRYHRLSMQIKLLEARKELAAKGKKDERK
jgi:hypothetical protein